MKKLKRLSTTISASFDSFINEFENQESIIKAALGEIKESKAILDVQQRKHENENLKLFKRVEKIKTEIPTWELRVKESFEKTPEIAHDCSKRILLLEKELIQIEQKVQNNNKAISSIMNEKEVIVEKINEIESKLNELKVKETKQSTLLITNPSSDESNLNAAIDRWESKLIKNESFINQGQETQNNDELMEYFNEKEFEHEIQKKINELTK